MKIKTQIFLMGTLFSVLPLILVSVVLIRFYNKELDRVVVDDMRSITAAQMDIIDNFFIDCDVNASILSDYDMLQRLLDPARETGAEARNRDRSVTESILKAQKEKREFIYSITLLDSDFKIVACTEPINNGDGNELKSSDMIQNLGRDIWFSHILEAGELGARERCLIAVKAIYNDQDQRIGYIVEEMTLEFFEELRLTTKLIRDGTVYIADGEGGLIAAGVADQSREDYVLEADQRGGFTEAWKNRDQEEAVGVIRYQIAGKTYLSSYGGFENSNWQILSTVCLDDILHTRDNFLQVLAVVLVLAVLLAGTVNIIMRRTLSAPIERMVRTFAEIREKKDFTKRIRNIPDNEMGQVALEINTLLNDIETTIRRQKENMKLLRERAERDSLTDLFNKNTIQEIIQMKIDGARVNRGMLACILVDIDNFKDYNTSYGHAGGDAAIRFVASVMREMSSDTAGRIGGDEFIMCLDACSSREEVEREVKAFLCRLDEGLEVAGDGIRIPVPCSVGISLFDGLEAINFETLVELADRAMYQVKNSTKDGFRVY